MTVLFKSSAWWVRGGINTRSATVEGFRHVYVVFAAEFLMRKREVAISILQKKLFRQ